MAQEQAKKKHHKSLANLLHYFVEMNLTVELKTGRMVRGTLSAADRDMNLTMEDVVISETISRRRTASIGRDTPLSLVHIRGSTVRYIHFPGNANLANIIKQGMQRERSASQKYKRGVRKS